MLCSGIWFLPWKSAQKLQERTPRVGSKVVQALIYCYTSLSSLDVAGCSISPVLDIDFTGHLWGTILRQREATQLTSKAQKGKVLPFCWVLPRKFTNLDSLTVPNFTSTDQTHFAEGGGWAAPLGSQHSYNTSIPQGAGCGLSSQSLHTILQNDVLTV